MNIAKVIRFFGFSHREVMEMSAETFKMFIQSMPAVRAEEQMHLMTVSDYPHLKMDSRRKIHKQIWKTANPFFKPQSVSADKFFGNARKVKSDGE